MSLSNAPQQQSFYGFVNEPVHQNQGQGSIGSTVNSTNGLSGVLHSVQVSNQENILNGLATSATLNVIPSQPRVVRATARDISLFPPLTKPSAQCTCKKHTVSIEIQYENDPFLGKVYTKEECMTQGTEAFREVSVSF